MARVTCQVLLAHRNVRRTCIVCTPSAMSSAALRFSQVGPPYRAKHNPSRMEDLPAPVSPWMAASPTAVKSMCSSVK